jgi:antirestriction protein ArdC
MSTTDHVIDARERLTAAVERMTDSEPFAAWLRARAAFHTYSLNNILLIASQRPDATRIAGYRAFQKLGRQVRKGEKAIRILAPCRVKVGESDSAEATQEGFRLVGFKWANVFDISQTAGADLPELEYRPLEGEAPSLADFASGVAMTAGIEIRREPLSGGMNGYLRRSERLIVVDSSLSGAMASKVVCHELGHLFDPFLIEHPDQYAAHRCDAEAVAESVAYVVAAKFGLDAGPAAVGYIASWIDGDSSRVRDLVERIDASARAILGTEGGER